MKRMQTSLLTALLLAVASIGLVACDQPQQEAAEEGLEEMPAATASADGEWISLTDGESFAGWHGFKRDDVPGKWQIDDGALHFNPEAEGDGGDIVTDEVFEDFEMTFEWRIGECGNSGIMYRVAESDEFNNTYETGPEYQILDNTCHPDAENGPDRFAAANYALHPPSYAETEGETVTRPAGEWNTGRIIIDDGHVEHWLNDTKVVEYELGSDEWQELVAASKFDAMPGYGTQSSGRIALQDHGDPVWYRNIQIRRL